jgi:hypothetical protein
MAGRKTGKNMFRATKCILDVVRYEEVEGLAEAVRLVKLYEDLDDGKATISPDEVWDIALNRVEQMLRRRLDVLSRSVPR